VVVDLDHGIVSKPSLLQTERLAPGSGADFNRGQLHNGLLSSMLGTISAGSDYEENLVASTPVTMDI
jgi:hypothetical protein